MFVHNCISCKHLGLIFTLILGLLFSGPLYAKETETIKIYSHHSDGVASLGDLDAVYDWEQARAFSGEISLSPAVLLEEIPMRSDRGVGNYRIYRGSIPFDTSVVPTDATLNEVRLVASQGYSANDGIEIVITSHSRQIDTVYNKQDWRIDNFGTDPFSRGVVNTGGLKTEFIFSEGGKKHLNKDGYTVVGLLTEYDFDNIDPGRQRRSATIASSEALGTSTDPYLEITYTIGDDDPSDRPGLYTQIESPYPSESETASWASDLYNGGNGGWCGSTVGECGCVLTSLVMAGRDADITTDVLGADVNPGNFNEYLQSVDGYTSNGALRWLAAGAYFSEFQSDGTLASRLNAVPVRPGSQPAMSFIDDSLSEEGSVVLAYQDGHYVWLADKTDSKYTVLDPWWYNTLTADDVKTATSTYVRDYNNAFTDARVLNISESAESLSGTSIEAHLTSATAELLFENIAGDQVGYDAGQVVVDLEQASYGDIEIIALDGALAGADEGKHLLVYEAGEQFTIEVVGTGVGEFTFEFFTVDEFGETTTFTASGETLPGVTTTFTFDLETGEITEGPISEIELAELLNIVLADATTQQRKFFTRWIEKYFEKSEKRTVSQSLQQIDVLNKLFKAKKVKHPLAVSVIDLLESQVTE